MKKNLATLLLALLSTSTLANINPIKTYDGALRTCNSKSDVTRTGEFLYQISDVTPELNKSGYSKVSFSLRTLKCAEVESGSYSFIPYSVPSIETQTSYTGESFEVMKTNFKLVISNENNDVLKEVNITKLDGQKQFLEISLDTSNVDTNQYNVNQNYNKFINVNFSYKENINASGVKFTNQRTLGTYRVFFN